jgi:hypothetical protein
VEEASVRSVVSGEESNMKDKEKSESDCDEAMSFEKDCEELEKMIEEIERSEQSEEKGWKTVSYGRKRKVKERDAEASVRGKSERKSVVKEERGKMNAETSVRELREIEERECESSGELSVERDSKGSGEQSTEVLNRRVSEESESERAGKMTGQVVEALCDTGATKSSTGDERLISKMTNVRKVNGNMIVVGGGKLNMGSCGDLEVVMENEEGEVAGMTLKKVYVVDGMGKVTLVSNFELARLGYRSVFDWENSYVENKRTGERIPMIRKEDGWYLEIRVEDRREVEEKSRFNIYRSELDEKHPILMNCNGVPPGLKLKKWSEVAEGVKLSASADDMPEGESDVITWGEVVEINARRAKCEIPYIEKKVEVGESAEDDDICELVECGTIQGRAVSEEEAQVILMERWMLERLHRIHEELGHPPGKYKPMVEEMRHRYKMEVPKSVLNRWECSVCNGVYAKREDRRKERRIDRPKEANEVFSVDTIKGGVTAKGGFSGAYIYLDVATGFLTAYWTRSFTGVTAALSIEALKADNGSKIVGALVVADDGTEFTSHEYKAACTIEGIRSENVGSGCQYRNPVEGHIHYVKKATKAMMMGQKNLDKSFYPFAVNHAINLRCMIKNYKGKSPWELKYKVEPPSGIHRLVFGEKINVVVKADKEKKLHSLYDDEGRVYQGYYLGMTCNQYGMLYLAAIPRMTKADGSPDWTRAFDVVRSPSCSPCKKVYELSDDAEMMYKGNDPLFKEREKYDNKTKSKVEKNVRGMTMDQARDIVRRIHAGKRLVPTNHYISSTVTRRATIDHRAQDKAMEEKLNKWVKYEEETRRQKEELVGLQYANVSEKLLEKMDDDDIETAIICAAQERETRQLLKEVKEMEQYSRGEINVVSRRVEFREVTEMECVYGRRAYANPRETATHRYPYLPRNTREAKMIPIWKNAVEKEYLGFKVQDLYEEVRREDVPVDKVIVKIFTLFDWKDLGESREGVLDVDVGDDGICRMPKVRAVYNGAMSDYDGITASPTPSSYLIRLIHVIQSICRTKYRQTGQVKWIRRGFDISQAFLEADIDVDTYAYPPEEFYEDKRIVWKLKKALYGLKQAPLLWHKKMDLILKEFGMKQSIHEPCLYYKVSGTTGGDSDDGDIDEFNLDVVLTIHVDDGLIAGEEDLVNELMEFIKKRVKKLKILGDPDLYLGMQTEIDEDGDAFLHMENAIDVACKMLGLENEYGTLLPMKPGGFLPHLVAGDGLKKSDYQKILGICMYIGRMVQPQTLFALTYLSRFNVGHNEVHLQAVKHLLLYMKRHKKCGISLKANMEAQPLELYVDASFQPDKGDPKRRSYCGWVLYFYGAPIITSAKSIKRACSSSTHAEIIALYMALKEVMIVLETIKELHLNINGVNSCNLKIFVREDNKSCMEAIWNPMGTANTKDLAKELIYIRECRDSGSVRIDKDSWIITGGNVGDVFTKPLGRVDFHKHSGKFIKSIEFENPSSWCETIRIAKREGLGE